MKESIVILLTRKDAGPYFGYKILGQEFNKRGYNTIFIDVFSDRFESEIINAYENNSISFTLTHNTLKIDFKIDGKSFYEKYNTVCISLTDTPLPKYTQLKNAGKLMANWT